MVGKGLIAVVGVGALLLGLPAQPAAADGLELRLGAWEVSTRLAGVNRTSVLRTCVTKQDPMIFVHNPDAIEDDPCAPKAAPRNGRRAWSQNLACQDGSQIHVEFTSDRPEAATGTLLRIGGRNTLVQRTQITARWLSGSCKGVR